MTYEQEAASPLDYSCAMQVYPGDLPPSLQQRLEAKIIQQHNNRQEGEQDIEPEAALRAALSEMAAELAIRQG